MLVWLLPRTRLKFSWNYLLQPEICSQAVLVSSESIPTIPPQMRVGLFVPVHHLIYLQRDFHLFIYHPLTIA